MQKDKAIALMLAVTFFHMLFIGPAVTCKAEVASSDSTNEGGQEEASHYFEHGKTLHLAQKNAEAIKEYEKALAIDPDYSKARQALAWAKRDMRRQNLMQTSTYTLDNLVQEARDQYQRGQRQEKNCRLLEAAAAYKDALRLIPGYPEAKDALKRVQNQAQRTLAPLPRTSTSPATEAASGNKEYNPLENPVEETEYSKRIKTSGIQETKSSFKTDRAQAANPLLAGAKIPGSGGEQKQSQQAIRGAIQKHLLAGSQALDHTDYNTAIHEFELVLEFMPDHREAQFKLNQAKKKQAVEVKAAKEKVDQAKNQGDTYAQLAALRDVMNIDPNDEEAMEAWEKTKKENKGIVEEIYRKGVTAYAQGRYELALQAWELVLDLDPGKTKAQESINKVRQKMELNK